MKKQHKPGPKRGISLFSYSGVFGWSMDFEDCLADMQDMGAYGLEILANSHIPNYPYPDHAWFDQWFAMMDRYEIVPVEYGHWIESRLYSGRSLNTAESVSMLKRDMELAHRLGFKVLRTKMGVIDNLNTPVEDWREIVREALPLAEKLDLKICPELHIPTALKSRYVDDYVDFIVKEQTAHFGFNVDLGTFQDRFESSFRVPGMPADGGPASLPEDIIPILPYVYCCHAKFNHMDEDFQESTIPYPAILDVLMKHEWDGYLLSEYEGKNKEEPGYASEQLRRQHIMMKRILGE